MSKLRTVIQLFREDGSATVLRRFHQYALLDTSLPYHRPMLSVTSMYRYYKNTLYHGYDSVSDPLKVLWISPDDITYLTAPDPENSSVDDPTDTKYVYGLPEDNSYHFAVRRGGFDTRLFGRVENGTWDEKQTQFEEIPTVKGLIEYFEEGIDWEETTYFEVQKAWIENGHIGHAETIKELRNDRRKELEELYTDIKVNGYRSQQELGGSILHEVGVNIGRDGELFFNNDAHHRLTFAKLLDIERIPVVVIVRHKEWQKIRQEIDRATDVTQLTPKAKKNLSHPDLQDIDS